MNTQTVRLCYNLRNTLIVCLVITLSSACQQTETSTSSGEPTVVAVPSALPPTKKASSPSPMPTQSTPLPTPSPTPTATPATASIGGHLVFESRRQDTNGDGVINLQDGVHLYRLDLSTNALTQLTSGDHFDRQPSWSPDGSQIAFVSNREGNYDIYVIGSDGSDLRRLTTSPDDEEEPKWSPDGTQIAYALVKTLESGLQERHLYLMAADGRGSRPLTTGLDNDFDPSWSPDGRYLAFIREQDVVENGVHHSESSVQLYEMETGAIMKLGLQGARFSTPVWLPRDGSLISVVQTPGEFSSASLNVYEVIWEEGRPRLSEILTIYDGAEPYIWGPNRQWLIMPFSNNQQDSTAEALLKSFDLIVLPIDFRKPWIESPYSLYGEGILLTENSFYDNYPNWTP